MDLMEKYDALFSESNSKQIEWEKGNGYNVALFDKFDKEYNLPIHEPIRQFLLDCGNGAVPNKREFKCDDRLFTILKTLEITDEEENLMVLLYNGLTPLFGEKVIVPFMVGHERNEKAIVIFYHNNDGGIYLWDIENDVIDNTHANNEFIYKVSDSLDDFLNSLYTADVDYERREKVENNKSNVSNYLNESVSFFGELGLNKLRNKLRKNKDSDENIIEFAENLIVLTEAPGDEEEEVDSEEDDMEDDTSTEDDTIDDDAMDDEEDDTSDDTISDGEDDTSTEDDTIDDDTSDEDGSVDDNKDVEDESDEEDSDGENGEEEKKLQKGPLKGEKLLKQFKLLYNGIITLHGKIIYTRSNTSEIKKSLTVLAGRLEKLKEFLEHYITKKFDTKDDVDNLSAYYEFHIAFKMNVNALIELLKKEDSNE